MLRAELLKILERLAVSESDVVGQVGSAQMEVADSAHASGRIAIVAFAHEKKCDHFWQAIALPHFVTCYGPVDLNPQPIAPTDSDGLGRAGAVLASSLRCPPLQRTGGYYDQSSACNNLCHRKMLCFGNGAHRTLATITSDARRLSR